MIKKASPTIHAHLWTTTSSGASLQVGGETVAPLAMVIKQTDLLFILLLLLFLNLQAQQQQQQEQQVSFKKCQNSKKIKSLKNVKVFEVLKLHLAHS